MSAPIPEGAAKSRRRVRILLAVLLAALFAAALAGLLYRFGVIPHKKYDNSHFGIESYRSSTDRDGDSLDDQSDILAGAYAYVATKPIYQSRYYEGGYPNDGYGVCTDVVARALLSAGYDLQALVDEDRRTNPKGYLAGEEPDPNIDFRRVRNLLVYFRHTAIALTTDPKRIEEWQGGDVVVFEGHIGIVSDHRNYKGIPFVIHHGRPGQKEYEEDVLESYGSIVGHFRIS